ncbi:MAG: DEAD/DEAH box helicase [Longimicrobiales bacterium]|nr:DEAD/DEAH box helicase [Longimicrobiales bacterium]
MRSFEDLGIAPELVEALAAEGIETPTPLQEAAIPVIRKGNNLVLAAGPGSGLLAAWSVGLLDRIEPSGTGPRILVACPEADSAERLAHSTARLAAVTGHSVAALGSAWALPERSDVLFASVPDLLSAMGRSAVDLDGVSAVVFDQAQAVEDFTGLDALERILDYVPETAQRILSALPLTPAVASLVDRLFKRTVTVPSPPTDVPRRGTVHFRICPEPREAAALRVVDELLREGARHALVFCRNEDRAADVGDFLTLHGFVAGAPGDASLPVWLGIDALDARSAAKDTDGLVVVSCDAPTDPDMLDRRHSMGEKGVILVLPREVPHLKALGRRTGYDTVPFPPAPAPSTSVTRLRERLEAALSEKDTGPYLVALEPLFETHDPAHVAAAAVALLREGHGDASPREIPSSTATGAVAAAPVPSWAKLFVSVGERDGLRPGDLLGAITGEAGVSGDAVGRIDIHESHSLVEVHDTVARPVIRALNGTTIKGRSVRVDFDRPRRGGRKPRRTGRSHP